MNITINQTQFIYVNQIFNINNGMEIININTTNYVSGYYTMIVSIWDIFHISSPVSISIGLNIEYHFPSKFTSSLPTNLTIEICNQSELVLPNITDPDGDFSYIELIGEIKNIITVKNNTLYFNPASKQLGLNTLTIRLIDEQAFTNDYALNITIIDNFTYDSLHISARSVTYPYPITIDISSMFSQLTSSVDSVSVVKNNSSILNANYNPIDFTLTISSYTSSAIGMNTISVFIFDLGYSRSFGSYVDLEILNNYPPSITGVIPSVISYRGQDSVNINIPNDLFYDPADKLKVIAEGGINLNPAINSISKGYSGGLKTQLKISFYQDYFGNCTSQLIAYDILNQTSSAEFNVTVEEGPQSNGLYCNGPDSNDGYKGDVGFFLNKNDNSGVQAAKYFDHYIIISFAFIVALFLIGTEIDLNSSFYILESILLGWLLQMVIQSSNPHLNQYYNQIKIVNTELNSILLPFYKQFVMINQKTELTNLFILNGLLIIVVILVFLLLRMSLK